DRAAADPERHQHVPVTRPHSAPSGPAASRTMLPLSAAIRRLREHYGRPERPPTSDPFGLILYENVAYLASPAKRRAAFATLGKTVGPPPAALLAAKRPALEKVTAGGILKETFAGKLRECARIATEDLGGGLDAIVRGPLDAAKR